MNIFMRGFLACAFRRLVEIMRARWIDQKVKLACRRKYGIVLLNASRRPLKRLFRVEVSIPIECLVHSLCCAIVQNSSAAACFYQGQTVTLRTHRAVQDLVIQVVPELSFKFCNVR